MHHDIAVKRVLDVDSGASDAALERTGGTAAGVAFAPRSSSFRSVTRSTSEIVVVPGENLFDAVVAERAHARRERRHP